MNRTKGYGIVIPEDFTIAENGKIDIDEFYPRLVELDREAFYRMAKVIGLDLDLLNRADYHYEGLSMTARHEALQYMETHGKNFGHLAKYLDFMSTSISPSHQQDFDYVLFLYNQKTGDIDKFYDVEYSSAFKQELQELFENPDQLERPIMELFVSTFKDEYTAAREEIFEKYGVRFQSNLQYDSFASRRLLCEWKCKEDGISVESPEYDEVLMDLMRVYRLVKSGGRFTMQSSKYSARKAVIAPKAADILGDMIIMAAHYLRPFEFRLGEVEGSVDKNGDFIPVMEADNEFYRAICFELKESIEESNEKRSLEQFYYLVDNAIWWPNEISLTARYIFLYQLAILFGYVKGSEYDDLDDGIVCKVIVDKIKRVIKSQNAKDPEKDPLSKIFEIIWISRVDFSTGFRPWCFSMDLRH